MLFCQDSHRFENQPYRAWVDGMPAGAKNLYDMRVLPQLSLVAILRLREHHYFLDVGCGSLRFGRVLIPYLLPGRYFGIEPEQWVVEEGIAEELGHDILRIKRPSFDYNRDFNLQVFGRQFQFIWAQSVFPHASLRQIERCVSQIPDVLSSNGLFVFNVFFGGKDYEGDAWVYPLTVTYTRDTIVEIIRRYGLKDAFIKEPVFGDDRWVVVARNAANLKSCQQLITGEFNDFLGTGMGDLRVGSGIDC